MKCSITSLVQVVSLQNCPQGTFGSVTADGTSLRSCSACADVGAGACSGPGLGQALWCTAGSILQYSTSTCLSKCPVGWIPQYMDSVTNHQACYLCAGVGVSSCSNLLLGSATECATVNGVQWYLTNTAGTPFDPFHRAKYYTCVPVEQCDSGVGELFTGGDLAGIIYSSYPPTYMCSPCYDWWAKTCNGTGHGVDLTCGVSDGFGLPLLQFYLNEPAPLNICGQYCDAPYTMYRVDANGDGWCDPCPGVANGTRYCDSKGVVTGCTTTPSTNIQSYMDSTGSTPVCRTTCPVGTYANWVGYILNQQPVCTVCSGVGSGVQTCSSTEALTCTITISM